MTVEELKKDLLFDISSQFMMAEVPKEDYQAVAKKVDAFEAAVIQAERRRILDNTLFQFGMGDGTYMMIRTSVVDPKEEGKS